MQGIQFQENFIQRLPAGLSADESPNDFGKNH